jgi:hypothetical protein
MARTSGRAGSAVIETFDRGGFSNSRGTAQYSVSKDFSFEFAQPGNEGRGTLDYFIGAGNIGRSYVSAVDGFLFQTPVAWYAVRRAWDLSPGYELSEEVNLGREVGAGCLGCHATGLRPLRNTSNGFAAPPWTESGVGCERCHGSGEAHVRGNRAAIVNPARLSGTVRDSVCAQCHLPGAVEIARSPATKPYAPGENLSDSVAVFVLAGEDREANVNGHFEQLSRSRCLREGGGRLWCGTCHKVHSTLSAEARQAFYRQQCQSCHAARPCTASAEARAAGKDDCLACHMPRRDSATVLHAAVTDHTISRVPRGATQVGLSSSSSLTPFAGMISTDRELGLAYASVALRDNNQAWGLRAFTLLQQANAAHAADPKVMLSLAQLYDRMKREDEACALYKKVANMDETAAVAIINLGACLAKEGKAEDAIGLWQGVLETNPSLEAARLNLAVALFRAGRREQAIRHLREALRFNPASRKAAELLSGMR